MARGRGSKEGRRAAVQPPIAGTTLISVPSDHPSQVALRGRASTGGATPGSAATFVEGLGNATATLERDLPYLLAQAIAFEQIARKGADEAAEAARAANSSEMQEAKEQERDLLSILADGFAEIAEALRRIAEQPENRRVLAGKAAEVMDAVSARLQAWLDAHTDEVIRKAFEVSIFVLGTGALHSWGINTNWAAPALAALIRGRKAKKGSRGE